MHEPGPKKDIPAEFDQYAATGYSKLLRDPVREKFAGSRFFIERKFILLKELCARFGLQTNSSRWLDVGCGQGELLTLGKSHFSDVAGCDISPGMIKQCEGLDVRLQTSAHEIPFDDRSYDLITAVCVYHHVEIADRPALTTDIVRVLKPRGILCLIEHNPFNPMTQLIVRRSPIDKQARLLTAGKVRGLAREAGMQVLATHYFLYFPERYYTKLALTEAKLSAIPLGGQYAVFCRKA